jgi:hypothetical protein
MALRCKQGDLVWVNAPGRPAHGHITQCIEFLGMREVQCHDGWRLEPIWRIDPMVPDFLGDPTRWASDGKLNPIHDPGEEAQDETLQLLPVPMPTLEPA